MKSRALEILNNWVSCSLFKRALELCILLTAFTLSLKPSSSLERKRGLKIATSNNGVQPRQFPTFRREVLLLFAIIWRDVQISFLYWK